MKLLKRWRGRFFRTWPVAAAALGGLLVLIGTSVLSTSRKADAIVTQLDALNNHQREVERKLRRLRSDLHLSGIYIRDYLLDANRAEAPEYRERLTELRRSHDVTVRDLRTVLPAHFAPRLDHLERNLDDYWLAFEPLFGWTVMEKMINSGRFLRREVLPRREAVLSLTKEIEDLNDANLAVQRAEVNRRQTAFRDDIDLLLRRTLLLGFIVALVAVLRLRMLERRSDVQRARAEDAEREMRGLSQQLVAAQEEERKKLTRELHDHVGQMLTALRMEIGRADRLRGGAEPRQAQSLAEAKRLLDTILRSVRDLVMGLRPSMLDDFGLQPAIEWHVRDFRRRFNIPVDLTLTGELNSLPDQYRTCVYRILQEALTNCARHARPTRIRISVRHEENTIDLVVADDGVGFDPRHTRGMGLIGIEERVRELHGTLAVRPGTPGTEIHVTLPVTTPLQETELARAAG